MATDARIVDVMLDVYKDERHWVKGTKAKNSKTGRGVTPSSDQADQLCLSGLCERLTVNPAQRTRILDLIKKYAPNHYGSVPSFNDSKKTTIDDVRHVLRSIQLHFKHTG